MAHVTHTARQEINMDQTIICDHCGCEYTAYARGFGQSSATFSTGFTQAILNPYASTKQAHNVALTAASGAMRQAAREAAFPHRCLLCGRFPLGVLKIIGDGYELYATRHKRAAFWAVVVAAISIGTGLAISIPNSVAWPLIMFATISLGLVSLALAQKPLSRLDYDKEIAAANAEMPIRYWRANWEQRGKPAFSRWKGGKIAVVGFVSDVEKQHLQAAGGYAGATANFHMYDPWYGVRSRLIRLTRVERTERWIWWKRAFLTCLLLTPFVGLVFVFIVGPICAALFPGLDKVEGAVPLILALTYLPGLLVSFLISRKLHPPLKVELK